MGLVTKVLSFVRVVRNGSKLSDVKMDPGGGPNITGEHFSDPGDDAFPLPTDFAITVSTPRSGGEVPVGYVDPLNNPKTAAGEKRIYGRDSNGTAINEVWLKADGSVIITNASGSIEIKTDGEIEVTNAGGSITLTPTGDLTVSANTSIKLISPSVILGDLTAKELVTKDFIFSVYNGHVHGPSVGPTPVGTAADHTSKTKGA